MNICREICKAFGKQAPAYEQYAVAQTEIGLRLFERLNYLKINPSYVLDAGCGTGFFTEKLKKYYSKSIVAGLDLVPDMLQMARQKQGWFHKWPLIAGDMQQLPFESNTFDLIFANQAIHWAPSLSSVLKEFNRVLRPGGCLMFTTLGPDTFLELQQSWQTVNQFAHINDFRDMHEIGDMLMEQRFQEPVMDMEMLTLHYPDVWSLVKSLKAQGVRNIHPERNPGLTGKQAWKAFEQAFEVWKTEDGKCPLRYEVVYGHAWKGNQGMGVGGVETYIPVSAIGKRQR